MMQFIIFCFAVIICYVKAHARCPFNDTLFSNFTTQLEDHKGECKFVNGYKVEENKEIYEGRWYAIYIGVKEEQAKTINCFCWDCYFDKKDHYHDFLYLEINGTFHAMADYGTPIDEKNGIYSYTIGQNNTKIKMGNTFFYVDEDMLAYWQLVCLPDENIYRDELLIAFHRFADVNSQKNQEKVEQIYKELEARGRKSEKYKVRHEYCNYPPERENPFIKRKPKQC